MTRRWRSLGIAGHGSDAKDAVGRNGYDTIQRIAVQKNKGLRVKAITGNQSLSGRTD
jgi:hypothetical protein